MKLTNEQARELAGGYGDPALNLTVESNEPVAEKRWTMVHSLVVKDADGKYWATTYERGLTENQDIDPFEYQSEVEFSQVVKIPVTTYVYKGMGLVDSEG